MNIPNCFEKYHLPNAGYTVSSSNSQIRPRPDRKNLIHSLHHPVIKCHVLFIQPGPSASLIPSRIPLSLPPKASVDF